MSTTEVEGFTNEALASKAGVEEPQGEQSQEPQAVEPVEVSESQKLIEDKFGGSPEKLADSYRHLQTKLTEMGQDNAEMRRLIEDRLPADDGYREPDDDEIYENPAAVAERAYAAGDQEGVRKAVLAWKEEDPFSASVWFNERRLAESNNSIRSMFEQRLAPTEQRNQGQVVQDAYTDLSGRYDDFDAFYRSDAYGEVLNLLPAELKNATLTVLQGGDKGSIVNALEYVYNAGKGRGWAPAENGSTAVLGQELGVPSGSQPQATETDNFHAQLKNQVLAKDGMPDEPSFVSVARQLRADRNLQY